MKLNLYDELNLRIREKLNLKSLCVTIIGGGEFSEVDLDACLANGSTLISADGGANNLNKNKYKPDYIIGDLDSLKNSGLWKNLGVKLIKIKEQSTTDFEKCLYSVNAKAFFCTGFIGKRADHFLSVCSTLVKYHFKKVILLGSHDLIFHLPKNFEINLPRGTRVSLFPMERIVGIEGFGLQWPIEGVEFEPSKRIGTSNKTVENNVKISVSKSGMLVILPRSCFNNVLEVFQ